MAMKSKSTKILARVTPYMSLAKIKVFSVTIGSGGPVGEVSVAELLRLEPAELVLPDPLPGLSCCCTPPLTCKV